MASVAIISIIKIISQYGRTNMIPHGVMIGGYENSETSASHLQIENCVQTNFT